MGFLLNPYILGNAIVPWYQNDAFKVNGTLPTNALCFKKNRYAVAGVPKLITEIGTYTRSQASPASGLPTIINSSGYIENVSANVIRQTCSPLTGASEGVLIEAIKGNTIRFSEDFSQADWNNLAGTTLALDAGQINPRGINGSYYLTETATTGAHSIYALTNAGGTNGCCHSIFLKSKGRTQVRLSVWNSTNGNYGTLLANLSTGAIISSTGTKAQMEQYSNGWWRLIMAATPTTTKTERLYIELYNGSLSYTGDGTSGVYLFGAMTEQSEQISSQYIWANSGFGATTKQADAFNLNDISSWYSTSGTIVARYKMLSTGKNATRNIVSMDDGTTSNSINMALNDSSADENGMTILNSVSTIFSNAIGTYTQGNQSIVALAYQNNDILAAANEIYGSLDTSGTIPALNRLLIGNGAGTNLYADGIIQDILFYPRRLNPIELLGITSPLTFDEMDAVI